MALLRLELSQWKISFSQVSGIGRKADKKALRTLGIMAVVLFLAVWMVFMELKVMDVLISLQAPELLPQLLVMVSMILSLVMGLFQVISNLYFSRDILILGYLPVGSPTVYAGRLCGQLVEEIVISILFIMPATVIYFVRVEFDAGLLARALLVSAVSPVMPLSLGALLAGLLTKIPGFWKHREGVTTVFSVVMLLASIGIGFLVGQMQGSGAAEQESFANTITMIREKLSDITGSIPPIRWCSRGMTEGGLDLVLAVAVSAAAMALVCLLFGRGYLKEASRALETTGIGRKVNMQTEKLHSASASAALLRREILEMVRTPAYLTNGLLTSLLMPTFMVGIMLFSVSNAAEGGIRGLMQHFDGTGRLEMMVAGVFTALLGIMLGMNASAATSVSREGKRHALLKSLPVSTHMLIMSKLRMGLIFQCAGVLPAVVLMLIMMIDFWPYILLIMCWSILLAFVGSCLAVVIDASRPKMDWLNETEAIKSGFNQVINLLTGLAVAIVTGVATYLLLFELEVSVLISGLCITALLLLFCLLAFLMVKNAEKAYDRIGD